MCERLEKIDFKISIEMAEIDRMGPLSRDLAGLILDHQQLGTHLNKKNGDTTDTELE